MSEQLSPEQRAELCFPDNALCEFMSVHANRVRLSADAVAAIHDAIASAIRAAVEAERARCVQLARQSDKGQDLTGDELADLILSTEAPHG